MVVVLLFVTCITFTLHHVRICNECLFLALLGALAEWLADHPVMISKVLPLVLHALGNPELSVSSVSTLKKICRECKYDLLPYAANIVAVSQVTWIPCFVLVVSVLKGFI